MFRYDPTIREILPIQTLKGHSSSVNDCSFSADSRLIVSASMDHSIRVWYRERGWESGYPLVGKNPEPFFNMFTGRMQEGFPEPVESCTFSPDGSFIVSGGWDKSLKVWSQQKHWDCIRTLRGHSETVRACIFSPDGRFIISGSDDKTLKIWDESKNWDCIRTLYGHYDNIRDCAISPDGRFIASVALGNDAFKVWDRNADWQCVLTAQGWVGKTAGCCAFSLDGNFLLAASGNVLKIWNRDNTWSCIRSLEHDETVNACVFSPDSRFIVSVSGQSLKVWDRNSFWKCTYILRGDALLSSCAFSNDGQFIVAGGSSLTIWSASTLASPVAICTPSIAVPLAQPIPLVKSLEEEIPIPFLQTLNGHSESVLACAFSHDSRFIVSASYDKMLKVWDRAQGWGCVATIADSDDRTEWFDNCDFSPNGRFIVASTSRGKTLKIFDSKKNWAHIRTLAGHAGKICKCAFSPDGRFIISGSKDDTLRIWEYQEEGWFYGPDWKLAHILSEPNISTCNFTFSPDGRFLLASQDKTLKIWDRDRGWTGIQTIKITNPAEISCEASAWNFSPDGRFIVLAAEYHILQILNREQGWTSLCSLESGQEFVKNCIFTPSMRFIISTSKNCLKIWDRENTWKSTHTLTCEGKKINDSVLSPDGEFIVAALEDGNLALWKTSALARSLSMAAIPSSSKVFSSLVADRRVSRPLVGATSLCPLHTIENQDGARCNFAVSPDGLSIAIGLTDYSLKVWSYRNDVWTYIKTTGHSDIIGACAFSSDNRFIVSASHDKTLKVWDRDYDWRCVHTLFGHRGEVAACAFSPDGRYIVSGSYDCRLKFWKRDEKYKDKDMNEYTTSSYGPICGFSHDGRLIVYSDGHNVILEDCYHGSGSSIRHTLRGHSDWINACKVSPDDRFILSGSQDGTRKIWDRLKAWACVKTLEKYSRNANSCAFSSDGRYIIAVTQDNTLKILDRENNWDCIKTLEDRTVGIYECVFSQDGRFIFTYSSNWIVKIWSADMLIRSGTTIMYHSS